VKDEKIKDISSEDILDCYRSPVGSYSVGRFSAAVEPYIRGKAGILNLRSSCLEIPLVDRETIEIKFSNKRLLSDSSRREFRLELPASSEDVLSTKNVKLHLLQ
jgi:hypothetical protein